MIDLAYVEMIDDNTSGFAPSAEVRAQVDQLLAMPLPGVPAAPLDREAWLRGQDAAAGHAGMLALAKNARRGR